MDNKTVQQKGFPGRLGTVLCMWFLAGMPLSMVLSGVYSLLGMPLPPLFFFLSSMVYLTGGLLGAMWSRESLRRKGLPFTDGMVALFVLIVSVGFLFLSIVFVITGFQRL
jgi:hypothetical protein